MEQSSPDTVTSEVSLKTVDKKSQTGALSCHMMGSDKEVLPAVTSNHSLNRPSRQLLLAKRDEVPVIPNNVSVVVNPSVSNDNSSSFSNKTWNHDKSYSGEEHEPKRKYQTRSRTGKASGERLTVKLNLHKKNRGRVGKGSKQRGQNSRHKFSLKISPKAMDPEMLDGKVQRNFMCPHCYEEVVGVKNFEGHMQVCLTLQSFQCDICQENVIGFRNFQQHEKKHRDDQKLLENTETVYTCHICHELVKGLRFYNVHRKRHKRDIYNDRSKWTLQCKVCKKMFAKKSQIASHMIVHSQEKLHTCHICARSFKHPSQLTAHLKTHTGDRPYLCLVCGRTFYVASKRVQHVWIHVKHKDVPTELKPNLKTGQKSLLSRAYRCRICGDTFQSSFSLMRHIDEHNITYVCTSCDEHFDSIMSLESHLQYQKSRGNQVKHMVKQEIVTQGDTIGGKKVESDAEVNMNHIDTLTSEDETLTHLNDLLTKTQKIQIRCKGESWECSNVPEAQITVECCTEEIVHTTEPSPETESDGAGSSDDGNNERCYQCELNSSVNDDTGELYFQCAYCDLAYLTARALECHITLHMSMICPDLPQKTVDPKTHVCEYCGKKFTNYSHLTTHKRIHTGERPFSCELCGKGFNERGSVKRHMKTHSKSSRKS